MKSTIKIAGILDHETHYSIPFTKEKAQELLKDARENVSLAVVASNGRPYSASREQFLNDSIDDIVESHTKHRAVSAATEAATRAYETEQDRVKKLGIAR
jgi:hypothetical protein